MTARFKKSNLAVIFFTVMKLLFSLFLGHADGTVGADVLADAAGNALISYLHRWSAVHSQYIRPGHAFLGAFLYAQATTLAKPGENSPKPLFNLKRPFFKGICHYPAHPLQ